jgi:hypothetical protein
MTTITDWQDRPITNNEQRIRDEAVRLCRASGERQEVQAGGSEGVAYVRPDGGVIIWLVNAPNAIAGGKATLAE